MNRRSWALLLASGIVLAGLLWKVPALRAGESAKPAEETHTGQACPKPLTPEEVRVIVNRGTERPFSGTYWDHHEQGTYTCKRCGARLFSSTAKFDSGTGWPSFDEALPGAVRQQPDPDTGGMEIVCAACGGHLGHVFKGEGFTPKETRNCVNSVSLDFVPASNDSDAAAASTPGAAVPVSKETAASARKGKASTEEAFFAGVVSGASSIGSRRSPA